MAAGEVKNCCKHAAECCKAPQEALFKRDHKRNGRIHSINKQLHSGTCDYCIGPDIQTDTDKIDQYKQDQAAKAKERRAAAAAAASSLAAQLALNAIDHEVAIQLQQIQQSNTQPPDDDTQSSTDVTPPQKYTPYELELHRAHYMQYGNTFMRPQHHLQFSTIVSALKSVETAIRTKKHHFDKNSLMLGGKGIEYNVSSNAELTTAVETYIRALFSMLGVDLTDHVADRLFYVVSSTNAKQQWPHRDNKHYHVHAAIIYLTPGHSTTLVSKHVLQPPYVGNDFNEQQYTDLICYPAEQYDTLLLNGQLVHAGPANNSRRMRNILYMAFLPAALANDPEYDSNSAVVLQKQEMRHFGYTEEEIDEFQSAYPGMELVH